MNLIGIMLCGISMISYIHCHPPIDIEISPQWQHLDTDQQKADIYGGSWILVSIINIKKRIKDSVILDCLIFSWKGKSLANLTGSLYRKNSTKLFLPIEENLICDSRWNKKDQKLICKFEKPLVLDTYNEFCFVLTIPHDIESDIKAGQFELVRETLPFLITNALPKKRPIIITWN